MRISFIHIYSELCCSGITGTIGGAFFFKQDDFYIIRIYKICVVNDDEWGSSIVNGDTARQGKTDYV